MLAGNVKRIFIFCDNVTCFGTNESCWNRSHLPEFFIKAPHFLLAWTLCFSTIKSEVLRFSGRRSSQHPGIVLAGTIHTLAWKMRVEKSPLSFWCGILPGSFRFQTWCGDFQFTGCIKNSIKQAKATHLSFEKKNLLQSLISPCHMLPQKLSPNFRGHSFGFRGTPCSTNSFATLSRGKGGSIS